MLQDIKRWFDRLMRNRNLAVLILTVPTLAVIVYLLLGVLSPLFVGVLFAYLLEGPVRLLEGWRLSRTLATSAIITLLFMFLTLMILLAVPTLANQLADLVEQLPKTADVLTEITESINPHLPGFIGPIETSTIHDNAQLYLADLGKTFLETTLASVSDIFTLVVYGVLMPLLVFFLLRDKRKLLDWLGKYIPHNEVFGELYGSVDEQFGAYIRGKVIEGGIIGALSWVAFVMFGLNYAFILAVLVGVSVIIPFVGAILVTFPVLIVAYLQFGFSDTFGYLAGAYLLIQLFDGQLLVPVLFSEVVKIHPIAILVAIIFFGNLWGVWGVFFAIPLASLIKSFLVVVEKHLAPVDVP